MLLYFMLPKIEEKKTKIELKNEKVQMIDYHLNFSIFSDEF